MTKSYQERRKGTDFNVLSLSKKNFTNILTKQQTRYFGSATSINIF